VFVHNQIVACKQGKLAPNQLNSIVNACNLIVKVHEIEEVQKVLVQMKQDTLRSMLKEKLPEGADYIYEMENINPVQYEAVVVDVEAEQQFDQKN
jgi:hypothetical protein